MPALPQVHATLSSTTDPVSQGMVGAILVLLFVLLTLEKAHRVLVALGAVCLLWLISYLTPFHLSSFDGAVAHLDLNVLMLLAGMMALVGVLRSTGAFEWAVARLLSGAASSPARVLTIIIWFTGIASALADNVTTVIFVTPIALGSARMLGIRARALLLPMVMASNIGGTSTLIGDPPNIMIGSGAGLTFVDFLRHITAPSLFMLVVLDWMSARAFREDLRVIESDPHLTEEIPTPNAEATAVSDPILLRGLLVIAAIVLIGFLTHGITGMPAAVPAVIGAGAALILQDIRYLRTNDATLNERKHGILSILEHEIEWPTLAFFTFLFIIVGAAVDTGLVERIALLLRDGIGGIKSAFDLSANNTLLVAALLILTASAFLSALIDNIPFVAVCIPIIHGLLPSLPGENQVLWWALALGACLGGNGTPVGASANVTTLGLAEKAGHHISFRAFLAFGVPVTIATIAVSAVWILGFLELGANAAALLTVGSGALLFAAVRLAARRPSRR